MNRWKDSCECYWCVYNHPNLQYGGCISPWIEITPNKVNPETRRIDEDIQLNTKTEFWVECGPYIDTEDFGMMGSHDWDLDCGGDTWEEAVLNLGKLVLDKYGDYEYE